MLCICTLRASKTANLSLLKPIAAEPCFTASTAYSTWWIRPWGDQVETSLSYWFLNYKLIVSKKRYVINIFVIQDLWLQWYVDYYHIFEFYKLFANEKNRRKKHIEEVLQLYCIHVFFFLLSKSEWLFWARTRGRPMKMLMTYFQHRSGKIEFACSEINFFLSTYFIL